MERLLQWLANVATLASLVLQVVEKILARRANDEPEEGPE